MESVESYKRECIFSPLKGFCAFAKDSDFIEVCRWKNHEGVDVTINGKHLISLTYGEIKAINKLSKKLET